MALHHSGRCYHVTPSTSAKCQGWRGKESRTDEVTLDHISPTSLSISLPLSLSHFEIPCFEIPQPSSLLHSEIPHFEIPQPYFSHNTLISLNSHCFAFISAHIASFSPIDIFSSHLCPQLTFSSSIFAHICSISFVKVLIMHGCNFLFICFSFFGFRSYWCFNAALFDFLGFVNSLCMNMKMWKTYEHICLCFV